ncbi:MAG: PKD domain-containing protein [Bacteroidota bacterium]
MGNEPIINEFQNLEVDWEDLRGIAIVNENEIWYGLIVDFSNSHLYRLTFDDGFLSSPSIEDLGTLGLLNEPLSIDLAQDNTGMYAVIGCLNGLLVQLDFGNSITNNPSGISHTVSGTQRLADLDLLQDSLGVWHAWVTSFILNKVVKLDYNSGLGALPTQQSTVSGTYTKPLGVAAVREGNSISVFLTTSNGEGLIRLDYGEDLNSTPLQTNLGDFGILSDNWDFLMVEDRYWYGFAVNRGTRRIQRFFWEKECQVNVSTSNEIIPSNIYFQDSGIYGGYYESQDSQGNYRVENFSIVVTNSSAPIILTSIKNNCLANTVDFSAISEETIDSWIWDFGDGGNFTGQNTAHQYMVPGTYEVTLVVESDNGCGNRLTKEITIYEPPDPEFSLPAGQICTNGATALNNLTDTKGADSLITYQWLVDGELVSEEANPSLVFEEGGNKNLRLAASIPGCTETFEAAINVIQGPTVGFNLPVQLCAGEVITLENQSSGDNITDYEWSFGDGGSLSTLSAEAVEYTFAEAGTYNIALTANTSSGCANVASQTVTVFEQPTIGFTSDVACAGVVTLFTDTTTAGSNANIIAWNWDFGDGSGTSEVRNPSYTFPSAGTYTVSLTTQSSGGCAATSTQEVVVESPVSPAFTTNRVCPTEANPFLYQFEDNSTVVAGEIIVQRLWTVNGENFTDEEITYPFAEPGIYEVSLTTFASSGCNALVSQSVEVQALPQVRFAAAMGCVGEPIVLENQSGLNGWEAAQYTWDVTSVGTVFETSPTVVFSEAGEFPVTLTLETETGCTFSWDSTIMIQPAPSAAFEVVQLTGGAPFMVSPSNLSTDYSEVQWHINGELVSEEVSPSFTLETLGTYELALVALNDIGCTDTARQIIEVVTPTLDIAVGDLLQLDSDGSSPQLVLSIENQGTLAVSDLTVLVQLGDVVALTEQVDETLLPGQRLNYPLQTTLTDIRNQRTPVEYICAEVNIESEADENLRVISESDTTNNRACLALAAPLLVETPFPNPAGDEVVVSILLEANEAVQLRLISSMGELILAQQLPDAQKGLNTVVLDVSQTPAGIYTLEVTAAGQTISRRVIVRP